MGILDQAKSLAKKVKERTQKTALAQVMRTPVRVSAPVANVANRFAQATPTNLVRNDFRQNAPIYKQAISGFQNSSTFGIVPSRTQAPQGLGQKIAYGTGFVGGMVNPLNPINRLAVGLKSVKPIEQGFRAVQRPVGQYAGRLIAQGGAKKLLGTGIANAAQGIPYTAAYSLAKRATGKKTTGGELAANTFQDLALGSVPLVGGLLLGSHAGQYADEALPKFSSLLDKKPRFEISDQEARAIIPKNLKGNVFSLDKILSHDKLFENYPEFKKLPVTSAKLNGAQAQFDGTKIVFDENFLKHPTAYEGAKVVTPNGVKDLNLKSFVSAKDKVKAVLLHEIQHAIQGKEGFAKGGSSDTLLREINNDPKQWNKYPTQKDAEIAAFGNYKKLSGELESRAVAGRMDLPENLRSSFDPYAKEAQLTTGRTNPNDFITRFGDTNNLSAEKTKVEKKLDSILQTKKFGSRSQAKQALQRASAMGDETATKYLEQASKLEKQLSKTPKLSVEPTRASTTAKQLDTQRKVSQLSSPEIPLNVSSVPPTSKLATNKPVLPKTESITPLPKQVGQTSKLGTPEQAKAISQMVVQEGKTSKLTSPPKTTPNLETIKPNIKQNLSGNDLVPQKAGIVLPEPKPIQAQLQPKENLKSPTVDSSTPYFNTNRLEVSDKAKSTVTQAIEEVKPAIEKIVGKKLTNKEVVDRANLTAKTLNKAVGREQTAQFEAALLNTRQKLAKMSENGVVDKEYLDNLVTLKSLGTDIARKLQSFSIGAEAKDVTSKQAILDAVLKVNKNTDDILKAARGVDFNNLQEATSFYRKFIKPNPGEWIDLLRYNSMLSSPNTHINNFVSNLQGTGIIAPVEKAFTGATDAAWSAITGKERQYLAGEAPAYLKGYVKSVSEARQKFADVMTGKAMNKNPDLRSIPLSTDGKSKAIEGVLGYPMKLLEGADQFFQTLAKGGIESSQAYKTSKGIKVKTSAADEAAKRLFRGELGDNNGSHVLNMVDSLANTLQRLKGSDNPVLSNIAKFTFPFVKTPTNILKQGIEYSPLGASTLYGSTTKVEQVAKALMGTSIAAGTAMLLGSDRLSWAEPTDAKKKDQFRAAGMQPYSVKVGDKWISYSKLHPAIAFNFALVAALKNANDSKRLDDGQVETVLTGMAKWMKFFADQSYVKNIGDFVNTAQGDLEGVTRYLSNYPQQLVPFRALMGWVTRIVDPYQRKVDPSGGVLQKQLQQMMTQIPGLSSKIPARLDNSGQPIPAQNRIINAFSPAKVATENPRQKQYYTALTDTAKVTTQKKQIGEAIDSGRIDKIKLDPKRKNYYSAEYIRSQIEKVPKTDRAGRQKRLQELSKYITPEIAAEIKKIGVQDKQGLAKSDREMFLYDPPTRAVKIKERFAEISDKKRKATLLHYYAQLGIITPEVAQELQKLKGTQ